MAIPYGIASLARALGRKRYRSREIWDGRRAIPYGIASLHVLWEERDIARVRLRMG